MIIYNILSIFKWKKKSVSYIFSTHRLTLCYSNKHLSRLVFLRCAATALLEQTVGARDGMTLGHHLAAGGYHGTDWGLCTLTLGFFWSTVRETGCDRVRGNGRRGIGPTDRPFWQRLALPEQMERERGTQVWHWSDGTGPAGFDLWKEDEHVWTTDESSELSEATGSLSEKVNAWSRCTLTYIFMLLCCSLRFSQPTVHLLTLWYIHGKPQNDTFLIWQALIWFADCTPSSSKSLMPLWWPHKWKIIYYSSFIFIIQTG